MNEEQLQALCRKWQARLRLEDWDVRVKLSRYYSLDDSTTATVATNLNKKEAVIRIRDPEDQAPNKFSIDPLERALVHELLHLHFEAIDPEDIDSLQYTLLEQAINAIAEALTQQPTLASLSIDHHPLDSPEGMAS